MQIIIRKVRLVPFQNPYITDGLVAMWDGEWNAGGGRHNPEAEIWTDCCGNEEAIRPYNDDEHLNWGDKWLNPTAGHTGPFNNTSGRLLSPAHPFTVEFYLEDANINAARYYLSNGTYGISTRTSFIGSNPQGKEKSPLTVFLSGVDNLDCGTITNGHTLRVALSFDGTTATCYNSQDAHICTAVGDACADRLLLGWFYGTTPMAFSRFHALRFYSRALGPREIMHNYELDRRRFG